MAGIPKCNDKFYDAMAMWEDGTFILCTSCLTGKYWSGSVWCFKNVNDVPIKEQCLTAVETDSGPTSVVSLKDDKILIGLDNGGVEVLALHKDPLLLHSQFYSCEHNDLVSCVDLLADNTKAISCSYDFGVKVWDLEAFCSSSTFSPAHGGFVHQVSACKSHPSLFLSCGQDCKIKLWDLRAGYKACVGTKLIKTNEGTIVPSAISFAPDSLIYAVGTESGEILLGDLRDVSETEFVKDVVLDPSLANYSCHSHKIRRLTFNPQKPKWLASCADSNDIVVTDISKVQSPTQFFRDSSHTHCVRDILWDVNKTETLLSCSWDSTVRVHELKVDPDMETGDS